MISPDAILSAIDALPSLKPDEERGYIGASEIGNPCSRYLWLKHHRFIEKEQFDPDECDVENPDELKQEATKARLRRLFQRGHDEELRFEDHLHAIGTVFKSGSRDQAGFRNGFFAGHTDGEIYVFDEDAIAEYKTHNRKSFNTLKRGELETKFPKHFAQAQCYMKAFKKPQCVYLAVCKDDDRLFCDVIPYDEKKAEAYFAKAEYVAMADKPMDGISKKPTFYLCRMCSGKDVCFGFEMPRINCRNCVNATKSKSTGTFSCEILTEEAQGKKLIVTMPEAGFCDRHAINPYFMNDVHKWSIVQFHPKERAIEYTLPDGEVLINGSAPFGVPSQEIKL